MNEGFGKFKRRFQKQAWGKSILLGASMGLLAGSGAAVFMKLKSVSPLSRWYWLLVLGLAVFAAVTGISYLIWRPTDRRTAKTLDALFGLGEKVQTMVEFREESGTMLEIQRADTDERLRKQPLKALKIKQPWKHIFAPAAASVLLIASIAVPLRAAVPPPPVEEPAFSLSDWQETALLQLMEEVRKSDLEDLPKQGTLQSLETLLTALKETKKESAMKQLVIAAISEITQTVGQANSYERIGTLLKTADSSLVKKLGLAVASLRTEKAQAELETWKTSFADDSFETLPKTYGQEIHGALESAELPAQNGLGKVLAAFADELIRISGQAGSYTPGWAAEQVEQAVNEAKDGIAREFAKQTVNEAVKLKTVRRLMEIFGIAESELPPEARPKKPGDDGLPEDDNDDRPLDDGGLGGGDILYGSNDSIYDPDKDAHVPYGEVINDYFAKISEQLLSGKVDEETQKLISDYFARLYNGSESGKPAA